MIFGFWAYAGVAIGSAVLSWARRRFGPKGERNRPTDFGQLVDPQTQRAGTIPWAYGRIDVGSGVLLVYGGKQAFPLNENGELVPWWNNVGGNTPSPYGYHYHLTFAIGICIPAGTSTYLRRIRCNGQTIWSGRAAGGSKLRIGGASIDIGGDGSAMAATFNAASNIIEGIPDHPYDDGDGPVRLIERNGTLGSGLAQGTDYWIIRNGNTISLASSRADAIAGTAINFGSSSATGVFTMTFRETLTFAAGDVDTGTDQINIDDHGLATGQLIRFVGDDLPEPIPSQGASRDWFAIAVDPDNFRVARSFTEALEGAYINLTDAGTGNHTLLPQPDTENFLGGPLRGGGIGGVVEFHSGTFTQTASSLLTEMYTHEPDLDEDDLPAHRGMAYVVFGGQEQAYAGGNVGFYMGEAPSMHDFSFEIETNCDDLGAGAITTNGDGNPAEFLRQLRVSDDANFDGWYGLGRPADEVDDTSYSAAAATLETEGHTFNAVFALGQNAEQIEADVLDQIGGVIRYNPSTGKVELKLLRDDYVVNDLPVLDETLVEGEPEYSAGTWEETYNATVLRFPSRALDYTRDAARAHDTATQMAAHDGMPREHEVSYAGVVDRTLATRLAYRDLKDIARPRAKVTLACKRAALYRDDGTLLLKGDPFVWTWTEYGISQMVMRIEEINLGTLTDPRIRITATQDGFTAPSFGFEPPPPPTDANPVLPSNITVEGVMEAPRWFGYLRNELILDIARLYYLAGDTGPGTGLHNPQVSDDAGVTFSADLINRPFCAHGVLELDLPRADEPWDASYTIQVEDVEAPNGMHASTVMKAIVADSQIRTEGRNLAIIGDPGDPTGHEIVAWEDITQLDVGNYILGDPWRGLLDTVPQYWPAGTRIWFLGAVQMTILSTLLYDGDESLKVRLVPVHSWLGPMDPELATQIDLSLNERTLCPYPPASFRLQQNVGVNEGTATNDLSDEAAHPDVFFDAAANVVIVENELLGTWLRRDRLSEFAQRGDEADDDPSESTRYDIEGRGDSGDAYVVLDDGSGVQAATSWIGLALCSWGTDGAVRIYAEHVDSPNRRSLQAPTIDAPLAFYRNLLRNPSFERSTDTTVEQWTIDSDAEFSANGAGGGRCFGPSTDAGAAEAEQTVDVGALVPTNLASGGYARLTWLDKLSSGAETVTPTLQARNAADGVIDTDAPGALSPVTTSWTRRVRLLALSAGECDTLDDFRLHFSGSDGAGTGSKAMIDECDLRLADLFDCFNDGAAILLNAGFNADLANWTTSGAWAADNTSLHEGARNASCAVAGEMSQVGTLPTGYDDEGDVVWVSCWRRDDGGGASMNVIVEILDSADAVLASVETGAESVGTTWLRRDLYVTIPDPTGEGGDGTVKLNIRCVGVDGGAGVTARVDDFQAVIFKSR